METPTFDWLDEGESWNALGTDLTAKVEIKDGAICLIITDSNNDGVITIADRDPELKNDPDTPGKVLRVNIDDDDMDVVLDKWQRPNDFNVAMNPAALADSAPSVTVQNEDDLAELILYVWIECLEKENGDSLYFDVYSVFPNDLVMWTAETKGSRIHRGVEVNERITEQTRLATLSKEDGKNIFTHTVYMEANASLVGTVVLIAQPVLNTPIGSGSSDSVKMTLLEIDLDIDSDNSSLSSVAGRTALEEFLEDHDYAPGKVILPNFGDFDNDGILDCWDGYKVFGYETQWANNASHTFTQIVVSVLAIEIEGFELQFTYREHIPMARLTGGNQPIAGGNGHIRIWKKDGNLARTVADYVASGISYTLTQLGWVPGQTSITLYVEGIAENIQTTRQLAENNGKPSTSIIVNYFLSNGGASLNVGSDEVFYVVAKEKSFYYELLTHPELVATYTSSAIYNREDKEEFAFRIQTEAELENLGLDSATRTKLSGNGTINGQSTGFNAALYREYITGKYVLTFAGTNPISFDDWRTNFAQVFLPGGVNQYNYAIEIAERLMSNGNYIVDPVTNRHGFAFSSSNTYIAGHSLGGGLASAASITSGFHAYTFNASGLHPATVFNSSNLANANSLITSYKMDWDILSWGQYVP